MPYRLAAFADEVSTDIQVQMDHLLESGIKFCAMRGANAKQVLELEDFQINLCKTQFFNRGVRFSCIASTIGKVPASEPLNVELERLKKAAKIARAFETKVVRVFSFCTDNPAGDRAEILRRMKALADTAKAEGMNLLVENDKGTYAASADRHLEVLAAINSPHVRAAFDFASYVLAGDDPLTAWPKLKNFTVDIHIKDCQADGTMVPAGQGVGKIREVLKDAFVGNWSGYLTLEPHLQKVEQFSGFTGTSLFKPAAQAFLTLLPEVGAK